MEEKVTQRHYDVDPDGAVQAWQAGLIGHNYLRIAFGWKDSELNALEPSTEPEVVPPKSAVNEVVPGLYPVSVELGPEPAVSGSVHWEEDTLETKLLEPGAVTNTNQLKLRLPGQLASAVQRVRRKQRPTQELGRLKPELPSSEPAPAPIPERLRKIRAD